jgi:membrane carboxypeptidase/penicillin-binding protein
MMKLVLGKDGTAPNFRGGANLTANNNISGKTGSGMVADCWFFALTPKVVVGVWFGLPNNEIKLELDKGFSGGTTASPVTASFFRELAKIKPELVKEK